MLLNSISLNQLSEKLSNIPLYNAISSIDVLSRINFFKDVPKDILAGLADEIEPRINSDVEDGVLSFTTTLMWSHAEYAMASDAVRCAAEGAGLLMLFYYCFL
ncbi:MAG: hypothetical protein JW864_17990 [Spirochaetes bacterium]|nr:hypothetical protein [Spirochaetota bacterium]